MSREPFRLTRRDVLRGAAVAGAAALVDPGGAVARTAAPGAVFSRGVGTIPRGETGAIAAPGSFSLLGVEWRAPRRARIELRTHSRAGAWSPWVNASVLGHDPDGGSGREEQFGEPIWTGPAEQVQLRAASPVEGVRLHFVSAGVGGAGGARVGGAGRVGAGGARAGAGGARVAQALPLAQPVLDAGPGQPAIIARAAWAHGHAPPRHAPEYGTIKLAFVHHSETPNGYGPSQVPSILLSIFAYHRYVRDYFDIAYNFAVDAFGRIWEARAGGIDLPVMGAHAGGYNLQSTGVVVLGTFMGVSPSSAAIGALERLLAWKLSLHGVPALGRTEVVVSPDGAVYTAFAPGAHVSLPRIAGHRDGDQTSCPGDVLYRELPSVRPRVAGLAGSPARLTIVMSPASPTSPTTPTSPASPASAAFAVGPGTAVTAGGQLTDLGTGAPIEGATIEVQQITGTGSETTIAVARTDSGGAWTCSLAPAQNLLVRALRRAAPAAVSGVATISVAPAVTLSMDSITPLTVSGTVAPAGPRVTVDLYRVMGSGHRRLVANKHVTAAGGSFRARFKHPGPGHYIVIARTVPNARFAAGASPALPVTL